MTNDAEGLHGKVISLEERLGLLEDRLAVAEMAAASKSQDTGNLLEGSNGSNRPGRREWASGVYSKRIRRAWPAPKDMEDGLIPLGKEVGEVDVVPRKSRCLQRGALGCEVGGLSYAVAGRKFASSWRLQSEVELLRLGN